MELDDVEIGQKYRCDYKGAQYFATVVSKKRDDMRVLILRPTAGEPPFARFQVDLIRNHAGDLADALRCDEAKHQDALALNGARQRRRQPRS